MDALINFAEVTGDRYNGAVAKIRHWQDDAVAGRLHLQAVFRNGENARIVVNAYQDPRSVADIIEGWLDACVDMRHLGPTLEDDGGLV